jgi:hypothetical protein
VWANSLLTNKTAPESQIMLAWMAACAAMTEMGSAAQG